MQREREKDRQLLQQFLGDGRGRGFEGAGGTGTSPETLHSKERGNSNAAVFQAESKFMAAKSQSGTRRDSADRTAAAGLFAPHAAYFLRVCKLTQHSQHFTCVTRMYRRGE